MAGYTYTRRVHDPEKAAQRDRAISELNAALGEINRLINTLSGTAGRTRSLVGGTAAGTALTSLTASAISAAQQAASQARSARAAASEIDCTKEETVHVSR